MKNLILLCFIALVSIIACRRPHDKFRTTNFGATERQCPVYGGTGIIVYDEVIISIKEQNAYLAHRGIYVYDSFAYNFNPGIYEFCDCSGITFTEGSLNGYSLITGPNGFVEHH